MDAIVSLLLAKLHTSYPIPTDVLLRGEYSSEEVRLSLFDVVSR